MSYYRDADTFTKVKVYKFVVELRHRNPKLGAKQIRKIVQEKFGILIGEATIKTWIYHGVAPVKGAARKILKDKVDLKLDNIRDYKDLDIEERVKLYEEASRLVSIGYNPCSVASALRIMYGVNIDDTVVRRWFTENRHPERVRTRGPVNLTPTKELAIIAASRVSDGCITNKGRTKQGRIRYCFSLQMKDFEPVKLVADCLEKVTGYKYKIRYVEKKDVYHVCSSRQALCEYLMNEDNILNLLHRFPVEFIRMSFEAEGGPTGRIETRAHAKYMKPKPRLEIYFIIAITVSNYNKKLLEEIRDELRNIGIQAKLRKKQEGGTIIKDGRELCTRKTYWGLEIIDENSIKRYAEKIGFISKRKQEKLNDIIDIREKYGGGMEAALEWIRRYKPHRKGNRIEWVKRRSVLTRKRAILEFKKLIEEKWGRCYTIYLSF